MSEQQPEKKFVNKTIAIALGIICIFLVVGLIGVIADYTSIISGKDNNISNLQSRLNVLTFFTNSTKWVNSQTIMQPASSYTNWTFQAVYAGFVTVSVTRIPVLTTPFNVSVEVKWFYAGVEYDKQTIIYQPSILTFPVLPASIEIRVGNFNLSGGEALAENVTITYWY
jgi:flagellar biosynthesis protein FliQ